jgi:large subunit ribosomal protein L10e
MSKPKKGMSYTRLEYIHRVPLSRITRFTHGNDAAEYDYKVSLIASHNTMISSNALEAIRITTNKNLTRLLGENTYGLKIISYPHEIIREHKFMSFAGADRLSQGMGHAFGRPTKRAAKVSTGQKIITVSVNKDGIDAAKTALKRSSKKLPVKYKISIEQIQGHTQQ